MKIKIIKAKFSDFWYANKIGEIYDVYVTDYRNNQHTVTDCTFIWNDKSVGFEDCEIIEDGEK